MASCRVEVDWLYGTAFAEGPDMTCGNWTRSGTEGAVMVGHHDRTGLDVSPPAKSWNASHPSRGGCSQDAFEEHGRRWPVLLLCRELAQHRKERR